jgi:membrane protease YdiL (CAAX protease family)
LVIGHARVEPKAGIVIRHPIPDGAATAPRSHEAPALLGFVALTFGWSWGLWWVIALGGWSVPVMITLQILSGIGPSLSGLVVVWGFDGRAGVRLWLRRCLGWRLAPGWYALAVLGPPFVMLAALALHGALGGTIPASPTAGHIGMTLLQFVLVLLVGGPLGEEFGWRGYVLPALVPGLGWRWASLIVGAIWALWHLPLFYMAATPQAQMPMALFMASSVALSVLFARLSVNTGFSVLPAIVLHWSINAGAWAIPVTPQGQDLQPYQLVMGLLFMVALVVFFLPGPAKAVP